MALFVIVLCLLSERFLVQVRSHQRFHWFLVYANAVSNGILKRLAVVSPWIALISVIVPVLFVAGVALFVTQTLLYGFVGLLLQIGLVYYCLGPENPFYPAHAKASAQLTDKDVGDYLVCVNGQLFAILIGYIVFGPLFVLAYRLISLAQASKVMHRPAHIVLSYLDWIPVRMTALLYLLVGNFQPGFSDFCKRMFVWPSKNTPFLFHFGLSALSTDTTTRNTMQRAELLVEHATLLFLVLLALCTLAAWF